MSRAYRAARFDPPEHAPGSLPAWYRVFRCDACGTFIGRQRIGPRYGPDEHGYVRQVGHTIERIELWRELQPTKPTEDGLRAFGLPVRALGERPGPPGIVRRPARRRATAVLPTVEVTDQFGLTQRGDPVYVTRHDPRRARGPEIRLVLALSGPQALEPFVVTCPNRSCKRRWLVGGLPPEMELLQR